MRFWTTFWNSQHLDLRLSWKHVQRLQSFGCGSATLPTFQRIFCLQNNKSDYTASHPRDNLLGAQNQPLQSFRAPLPYLQRMTSQAFALQSNVSVHHRQEHKTRGYKEVGKMGIVQCLCCAFLYIYLAVSMNISKEHAIICRTKAGLGNYGSLLYSTYHLAKTRDKATYSACFCMCGMAGTFPTIWPHIKLNYK
jgi:hypothetical protein